MLKIINYLILLILLMILIFLIYITCRYNYIHYYENNTIKKKLDYIFYKIDKNNIKNKNKIPNIVFLTYHNKNKIPKNIYENLNKYAHNYKIVIYNDKEALLFLNKYFGSIFVDKFNKLRLGAHKADLLRYCFLYIYGGVYMDIKLRLLTNLDNIINEKKNKFYTVLSLENTEIINFLNQSSMFQGFIAVPPNNFIIKKIIYKFMYMDNLFINIKFINYLTYCEQMYKIILDYNNKNRFNKGIYNTDNFSFELFQEINKFNPNNIDKYGRTPVIINKNNQVIIDKHHGYPW